MIACTVCSSHGVLMRVVALGPRGDVLAHDDGQLGALYPHLPMPYRVELPYAPTEAPAVYRIPQVVLVVFHGVRDAARAITGKGGWN